MSFLDAPNVKRSIEEANFLRERLIEQTEIVLNTRGEDGEVATEYLHTLYALVEKEHLIHTRLRLSDDQEALEAASRLDGAKIAATHPDFANADQFYRSLKADIHNALEQIDDLEFDDLSDLW